MTGKTVLITGGTGGIGRAAATGLASMGARVGITGRDRDRAERAAAAIVEKSGNSAVDVFVADLSSQAEVRRLAGEVLSTYRRARRPSQQRRRFLGSSPCDCRRTGADIRTEPSRAIPLDDPPDGSARRERTIPCRHCLIRGTGHGEDRLRRSDG